MYRLLIHIRESHREFRQQFIAGGIVSEKSIYTGMEEIEIATVPIRENLSVEVHHLRCGSCRNLVQYIPFGIHPESKGLTFLERHVYNR